ncbi:sigma-70 family RNA polymerase sigma factor [Thermotalea metallivorans]|uniref:ECF RNA polymerase sigma factor SigW n=1 Tax=Thermotalea metallivorans TaxID=520762 RepID=A0A140L532_9FIRM|nr:sigma-70 family RNA polymerase sigma factor [Thermotalea metallivorans]KXG75657.1 ECF RNA polymerase sigma factor SigW [Thermotalea metallivorans]
MATLQDRDHKVIEEILKGNGERFHELIARYKNGVYSICLRMVKDREEARDLAQEVFIKAYYSLKGYNREYKFSTWIFKIATNLCIDHLRKRKAQTLSLDERLSMPYDAASAESVYFHRCNRDEINRVIDGLPEDYRILIILYHKEGLSYQDICQVLDLPMSKVKNRLHRARNMLKEKLREIKEEESGWTAKELQV